MMFQPRFLRRGERITLILMFTTISLFLPASTASDFDSEGCGSIQLLETNETSPHVSVDLTKGISIKIAPGEEDEEEELLRLQLFLETQYGGSTYFFEMEANNSVSWDTVMFFDVHSQKSLLQVTWPRVLTAKRWTTLTLSLATEQLLQIVVSQEEQEENLPKRELWLGASVGLFDYHQISRMRLLLIDGSSLQYVIQCGSDFTEAASRSESESTCIIHVWRTWLYILLFIAVLQLIIIFIVTIKYILKINWASFKACFKQNSDSSNADERKVARVSFSKRKSNQEKSAQAPVAGLEAPNVIMGVVSSRAPSPGLEMDEQTTDYINKAYMSD